ncbi:tRNA pseudouridine(55) synthase TruB [Clostridium formicaceticum]|uniref:tRNA pseudouridine synthase B n=1 Tax=Clostridium formicaceticum TaxID=1497 RepID=A0AAC9WGG7_9CLOT|nr:tRNA pseudouridine(55) synthase TruB [Clostridium formicaceticum]AOY77272.1 tRNA pseudouridine(55) synthase TruB [Clostridium formicaceticum]ARE87811.1 tRNA pseudouridine synthase B [Clostridium formicaceticum]
MKGILNILKPPGMTSHDVVARVRKKTKIKKVGHTGTLDPNAAGVLPICIGQATKISQFLLDSTKQYRAELTLGIETDTQDIYGNTIEKKVVKLSSDEIEKTILSFVGEYYQTPPMYSALKVKGKKLYELARQGIEISREARKVQIHQINIIRMMGEKVLFDVVCSKGTYIRTLCHDIGKILGCGGVMSFLLRTATHNFDIGSAITLEELQQTEDVEAYLKPIDFPLSHILKIDFDAAYKKAALNGNKLYIKDSFYSIPMETEVRIYVEENFIGIGNIKEDSEKKRYVKFSRLFA